MAIIKNTTTHIEMAKQNDAVHHTNQLLEYDDDVVLDLDVGKADPELANNLKVAKDGHVRSTLLNSQLILMAM